MEGGDEDEEVIEQPEEEQDGEEEEEISRELWNSAEKDTLRKKGPGERDKRKLDKERHRLEQEKKKLEEVKKGIEKKMSIEEEKQKIKEQKRQLQESQKKAELEEEKRRLEDEKKRLAEERERKEEIRRLEEEKKRLEEEKLKLEQEYTKEEQVLLAFGTESYMSWSDFTKAIERIFSATEETTSSLKFCLVSKGEEGEIVKKETWQTFVKWFTPLGKQEVNFYQSPEVSESGGYSIDEAAAIVAPLWFHGHLSASKAQQLLSGKPPGSFLFRFSSNPGYYTLSVALTKEQGGVAHWRITADNSSGFPSFKVDSVSTPFNSLPEIIDKHQPGNRSLPLKTKGGVVAKVHLETPVPRS